MVWLVWVIIDTADPSTRRQLWSLVFCKACCKLFCSVFVSRVSAITLGGISKASKGINLSEDIFGGFNFVLRGGKATQAEYIQVIADTGTNLKTQPLPGDGDEKSPSTLPRQNRLYNGS